MRVHRSTPGYIIREELKRGKVRVLTGKKAAAYEARKRWGINKLLSGCVKQITGKERGRKGGLIEKRTEYYERCWEKFTDVQRGIQERKDRSKQYAEKDKAKQRRKR